MHKRFEKEIASIILRLRYFKAFKRCIELKKPKLFYDKIFWNSLNTDTLLWSELSDKYLVRNFVKERCGESVLNELYGVYNLSKDIDYEKLPDSFVLKTNNGCASNIIVKDKSKLDKKAVSTKLDKWLKYPYGLLTGQPHYSKIEPKIIAEKLLIQDNDINKPLIDYKFYCFDGVPLYCNILSDRVFNTHIFKRNMYDLEWNPHPEFFNEGFEFNDIYKPDNLQEMISIASKLSKGFPFVRVDLYEINKKPIFGEMTFMPGTDMGFTHDFQLNLGKLIK